MCARIVVLTGGSFTERLALVNSAFAAYYEVDKSASMYVCSGHRGWAGATPDALAMVSVGKLVTEIELAMACMCEFGDTAFVLDWYGFGVLAPERLSESVANACRDSLDRFRDSVEFVCTCGEQPSALVDFFGALSLPDFGRDFDALAQAVWMIGGRYGL